MKSKGQLLWESQPQSQRYPWEKLRPSLQKKWEIQARRHKAKIEETTAKAWKERAVAWEEKRLLWKERKEQRREQQLEQWRQRNRRKRLKQGKPVRCYFKPKPPAPPKPKKPFPYELPHSILDLIPEMELLFYEASLKRGTKDPFLQECYRYTGPFHSPP